MKIIKNILVPPVCQIEYCHNKVWKNTFVCLSCLKSVHQAYVANSTKMEEWEHNLKTYSLFTYTKVVQEIIHGLKYKSFAKNASFLMRWIHKTNWLENYFEEIDLITCVPLHRIKKRERGYNQSELLGEALADYSKCHLEKDILIRNSHTKTQTKLSLQERTQNISDVFFMKKKKSVSGKNILLVDDVQTTGATIQACSKVLLESGATSVHGLTLAKA